MREQYTEQEPDLIGAGGNSDSSKWTPERVSSASRNALLVIAGCIILGIFVATSNIYYVAAAIGLLVMSLIITWQFEAVLVAYTVVAFVPWGRTPTLAVGGSGMGQGLYVSEAMLGILLVVWTAKYLFGSLPKNRICSGFYVPMGLYLAYCVINVVNSFVFWDPHVDISHQSMAVNAVELGLRLLSAGALVMIATTISSRKWLTATTWALLFACFFNLANGSTGTHVPLQSPYWQLLVLMPVSYAWAVSLDNGRAWWQRGLGLVVVALSVYGTFFLGLSWISGWIGIFVALFAVTLLKSRKMALVYVLVMVVAVAVLWPFLQKNVISYSQSEGDFDRFALLSGAWRYATTFPLGVGIGNYRTYNSFYYGAKWGTTQYGSAHGTYAQALAETGVLGLVALVAILAGGLRWMAASYRQASGDSKLFLIAAIGHTAGIATAMGIGDYLLPSYHNGGLGTFSTTVYTWLIWGLAIAHVRLGGETV